MKNCIKCRTPLDDNAEFCTNCGERQPHAQQQTPPPPQPQYQQQYYAAPDPFDHTSEFSAKDVSDNKVMAMLMYLMGTIGIFIALLAGTNSPYVGFHVRQALKFVVANVLLGIVSLILAFTIIVPIAAGIMMLVLFVVKIIAFVQICQGKSVEPYIIRSLKFMR